MAGAGDRRDAGGCRQRGDPVAIVAPGFSADCLETLEELAIRGRETFLAAGGSISPALPCLNDSPRASPCCAALIGRELEGWAARHKRAQKKKRRRESWHALRSSPAAPAASARRSASRSRQGMTVAANYAGNEERAREFTERTGIKAYKWDVGDFDACQKGVQQVEASSARSTCWSTMPGSPATDDEADDPPGLGRGDRRQSRRLLQHGQGGVRGHAVGRKFGRIVNIGSINGQAGQYGQVNYAAAKSGIHGFTKALAQEGARAGVTVNAIAPGYIDTDMVAAVPPEDVLEKIVAKIPVGRLGKAEEIARGVAFLCGEDGGFITGSTLSINGGQHMY
jgi:acetoacetyl-CoA reductase